MKKIIWGMGVFFLLFSCGGNSSEKKEEDVKSVAKDIVALEQQLNITFLLDLSDRIEPSKYPTIPTHVERDMEVVAGFVEQFKADMFKKKNRNMKGKMKVLFSPAPQDASVNEIAQKLDVNTANMKPAEKTGVYKNLQQDFTENLQKIYDKTLETKNYIGSDIWRFFKNDAKLLAVETDPNYRNILVVITDGYIYHKNTKMKEQNRYSYILPQMSNKLGLSKSNWKEKMDKMDYGLIAPCHDLGNLEVLFLELNPTTKSSPYEEDVQKALLEKWLKEMGVQKFAVYKTDIPQTTKNRIESFMMN